jgi:hypothetical protein
MKQLKRTVVQLNLISSLMVETICKKKGQLGALKLPHMQVQEWVPPFWCTLRSHVTTTLPLRQGSPLVETICI